MSLNVLYVDKLNSACLNGWAGQGKPSRRLSKIQVRRLKSPYIYIDVVTVPYTWILMDGFSIILSASVWKIINVDLV